MSTKKSAKKLNKFTSSPLIIAIAIIEVVILICACTFAWFSLGKNTTISTQWLSVEPDSGLEIDFSAANEDDYVNISQYVIKEFKFEPVTSTDGRNIYVPTTGTFNETLTKEMVFREATVNDMNSKYICIDFTLTNTGDKDMPVFLSPRSTFKVDGLEGKALRLAFYQNDGAAGDIDTPFYSGDTTVYFRMPENSDNWSLPYAYVWEDNSSTNNYIKAHPGVPMTKVSDNLYYYTFDSDNGTYNKIQFNNGTGNHKTGNLDVHNGHVYYFTDNNGNSSHHMNHDNIISGTYPVVSPGVSVGFQRQYAPVTQIDNTSGSATSIVPAYANSIDNYSFGSNSPLFTIKQRETLSLSMIVWLEGTDPACTGETYSGRDININLLFATNDNNEEEYCTYTFYDATYETWIAHETASSTGASVKPVMQLYDTENQKGYLMTASEYTDDTKTHAKTWTVSAPKSVLDNGVIFRRVNPLDENEIWNFWDTRTNSTTNASYNDRVTVDNTEQTNYYFTAFSDGSPTNAKDSSENGPANAPAYSCGGLWGGYKTTAVKLYDGTRSCYFANADDEGTTGAMTINYTYQGQEVEYKASGPDYGFYTFVVPDATFKQTLATFKRYYNFNADYAINASEKQTNIKFDNAWNAGSISGRFFEINQSPQNVNNGEFITYWGDEVIYIQNDKNFKDQMDNGQWRVKFTKGNNSHYTYLYKHHWAEFEYENKEKYYRYYYSDRQSEDSYGYPCVVPSDMAYTDVRIEQCSKESTPSLWNRTPAITLTNESNAYTNNSNYIFGYNTRENTDTVINVLKLTNLEHKIFFQVNADMITNASTAEVSMYAYKNNGGSGNEAQSWPGITMQYVDTVADDKSNKLYLKPTAYWKRNNRWFGAYFWGDDKESTWVKGNPVDIDRNYYYVEIPDGYTGALWTFFEFGTTEMSFAANNNKSNDLTIPSASSNNRLCVINDNNNGGGLTSAAEVPNVQYHTYSASVNVSDYQKAYFSIPVTEDSESTYIYLDPNSNWESDSAWFAAYFWNSDGDYWSAAEEVGDTGIYAAKVPSGYPNCKWVRMNSADKYTMSWDNDWNESNNLTVPTGSNTLFKLNSNSWDAGSWSAPTTKLKDNQVLYLQTNSEWAENDAWFAAYFFNEHNDLHYWVTAKRTTDKDGRYFVIAPDGYSKIIWVRMAPSATVPNFTESPTSMWNKTGDLDVPCNDSVLYTMTGYTEGVWSTTSSSPKLTAFDSVSLGGTTDHNGLIVRGASVTPMNYSYKLSGTIGDTDITQAVVHESYLSTNWP